MDESFSYFSSLAQQKASKTYKPSMEPSICREDIAACIQRSQGRRLYPKELVSIAKCFDLDTATTAESVLITRHEFDQSYTKFTDAMSTSITCTIGSCAIMPPTRMTSRVRLLAARKKGHPTNLPRNNSSACDDTFKTSSQEVGCWSIADRGAPEIAVASELAPKMRWKASTDVTAGGEGTSLTSYYGQYLGRAL